MKPIDLLLLMAAVFAVTGCALIYPPAGLLAAAVAAVAGWVLLDGGDR